MTVGSHARLQTPANSYRDRHAHIVPHVFSGIEVPRVDYEKLSGDHVGESSECIRARVQAARDIQRKRFSNNGSLDIVCNADMHVGEIREYCKLPEEGQSLMRAATSCCA